MSPLVKQDAAFYAIVAIIIALIMVLGLYVMPNL